MTPPTMAPVLPLFLSEPPPPPSGLLPLPVPVLLLLLGGPEREMDWFFRLDGIETAMSKMP